jgi:pantoate--beta-alanine ligase
MGALHEGHLSLLRAGLERADEAIVSIFVNPTQFAPTEDLSAYPRTFEADAAAIAGVSPRTVIYAPDVAAIYPDGFATNVSLAGPAAAGLEDRFRPTHFAGVATVVAKLFLQAGADIALFGEKDWQQLKVVTRMARDLDIPTGVIGCPTVREADGLAMSSRNRYLSADERAKAALVPATLHTVAARIAAGAPPAVAAGEGAASLAAAGFAVDYLEAREGETLAPPFGRPGEALRLLVAARIGRTRLIDNIAAGG